jgi:hypothetical protein
MASLLERVRMSGTCPPSLLSDASNEDGFEEAALRTLDAAGKSLVRRSVIAMKRSSLKTFSSLSTEFRLTSDMAAAESFSSLLQVSSYD